MSKVIDFEYVYMSKVFTIVKVNIYMSKIQTIIYIISSGVNFRIWTIKQRIVRKLT